MKARERTQRDFRCPICCSAIGHASCLICAPSSTDVPVLLLNLLNESPWSKRDRVLLILLSFFFFFFFLLLLLLLLLIVVIIVWSCPVLGYFLGILSHVSAAYRSLETQHFSQDMSSTKDGWQLYTPKNVRQTQPPQPGLFILQDSSKCTNHDGYYCQFWGSMDSFHFEREVLMPFHFRLLSSKDILVRWHGYVDKCPLLCAFVYCSNIWLIVLFALLRCY